MNPNWIIFILASIGLIVVGEITRRIIEKNQTSSGEGFLLAAKQVGAFVGAGTLMATGFSGWGFIGSPGATYAYGTIEIFANYFYAPAITFGVLLFANYMRKQAAKHGGLTIPHYLASTHRGTSNQKRLVHFFAGLATFVFLSVYMIGQIRAVGLIASEWLGISQLAGSLILLAVVVIFTMQGGLLAVAVTDTIMCMGMLIASIVVYVVIIRDVPMGQLLSKVAQMNPEFINPTTAAPYGVGKFNAWLVFPYALLFTTVLPYMSVRFLSLKEDIKIHMMALITAPYGLLLSLPPFVGLYMYYKNPNLPIADSAMPLFLKDFLHPAIGGVIMMFILFAMLSTVSSVLQSLASALSYDMFVSVANRESKYAGLLNRLAVLVTTIWTVILTFFAPQGMITHIAYIGTGGLISAFVAPTIMRVFIEADLRTCFVSMLVGFFGNVILAIWSSFGWVQIPLIAGAAGCVVYVIMGLVTNGGVRKPEQLEASGGLG